MIRSAGSLLSLAAALAMSIAMPAAIATPALHAQAAPAPATPTRDRSDLTGNWQGTLQIQNRETRVVLQVAKTDKGWGGKFTPFFEQGAQTLNTSSVSLDGSTFKFAIDVVGASYQGTMSVDGNSVVGTLNGMGPNPLPLTLVHATKETAWEIPAPPPPPKLMAADADPAFDVATIKPNPSGGSSLQQLTFGGRDFKIRNGSLADLIAFAYQVQIKQIVNAPDWFSSDRYDISAIPDHEGTPSPEQTRVMIRKLLADRFALKFHHDKREMAAYVLSIGKSGQKLTPTQLKGPLPGLGFRPVPTGLTIRAVNATMVDFTGFLQTLVLDRPVLDQTGLTGNYDLHFTFTPDDSQFNGHPPKLNGQTPSESDASAPNIFDAIQQELGLKLSPERTQVDVISIDHVEKPSAN